MATFNDDDPFIQVQQDVLSQLATVRSLFSSYVRIRSLLTTASSPELSSAQADLETAIGSLAEDLSDLSESVRAVEGDPSQYGLTAAEVARRQQLVTDVGSELGKVQQELAKAKQGSERSATADGAEPGSALPDPSSFSMTDEGADGDNYAGFEREQQLQILQHQDEHLDGVFQTVGNLRRQADDMGRELEEQREMLEVTDSLTDRVGGRLQTGMQKLQYVIRKNEDRWSSCCIAMLIMVLIILLVLLLVL